MNIAEKTPTDPKATHDTRATTMAATALKIGDTLTVVSGRIGGNWTVEDENGSVYMATPVE